MSIGSFQNPGRSCVGDQKAVVVIEALVSIAATGVLPIRFQQLRDRQQRLFRRTGSFQCQTHHVHSGQTIVGFGEFDLCENRLVPNHHAVFIDSHFGAPHLERLGKNDFVGRLDLRNLDIGTTQRSAVGDAARYPCEIERIQEIARQHDLTILQDAAQSNHSKHRSGKYCGATATLAAYSFHESKNLNCGEGGALVVNDPELVERAHFLQEKGTDRSLVVRGVKNKYWWVDKGSSFLLSDMLAAMLLAQIEEAQSLVDRRSHVTAGYRELFAPYEDAGHLQTPHPPPEVELNHHAFFVIFDRPENQQRFIDDLWSKNIYPYIGYIPLHSAPMGQRFGYKPEDVPLTEDIAKRIVRLPFYAELEGPALEYCLKGMGDTLRSIYGS